MKCKFYVNDSYKMFEEAVLYDDNDDNIINLHPILHSSITNDSVLVVDKEERKDIWFRYFPEGQVGNEFRLTVYGQEVDELVIINHTGEVLTVNLIEVKPGESMTLYK